VEPTGVRGGASGVECGRREEGELRGGREVNATVDSKGP
jgi:hypothetical protein